MTAREQAALRYEWRFWGRPKQLLPLRTRKRITKLETGRGFGKTRTGAEWIRELATNDPGYYMLIGPTFTDTRETMIEGESGLLSVFPYWDRPRYYSSKLILRLKNGSVIRGFSADAPDRVRGPNVKAIWGDEYGSWPDIAAYRNARMCMRIGRRTRMLLTSTPEFSLLCDDIEEEALIAPHKFELIGGSTYDNSDNLADDFIDDIRVFEGTEYGDCEIHGIRAARKKGALWSPEMMQKCKKEGSIESLGIVKKLAIMDPSASNTRTSDATGIVVLGQDLQRRIYLLGNYTVAGGDPAVYLAALKQAKADWGLDTLLVEKNNGGLTLAHTVRNSGQGWRKIYDIYSTKTKRLRAEPVIPLYLNGMVWHWVGCRNLREVEKQMTTTPLGEPHVPDDIIDAVVLGVHHLLPGLVNLKLRTKRINPDGQAA